jgi:alkaline phosphatase D
MITRRGLLVAAAATGAVTTRQGRAVAQAGPVVTGATATLLRGSLRATIRASAAAEVRLRAWPASNPAAVVTSPWLRTNGADAAEVALAGAATTSEAWRYQAVCRPVGGGTVVREAARDIPARPGAGDGARFTFAVTNCLGGWPGHFRPWVGLRQVSAAGPAVKFLVIQGDLGYPDNRAYPQTLDSYRAHFRAALDHPELAPLLRRLPLYAVQDDHDYGLDDCDKGSFLPYAAQAFAELVPGNPYPAENYRSWAMGGVEFFLTDNRRHRDNGPDKPSWESPSYYSVLGRVQREWLLTGLRSSTARVKVVFVPSTMCWYWHPGERRILLEHIEAEVSGLVVLCTGDKHAAADVDYLGSDGRVVATEWLAGPLDNSVKHRAPEPLEPENLRIRWRESTVAPDYRAFSNVVGLVDVDSRTSPGTIQMRFVRCEDGAVLYRRTLTFA